MRSFEVFEIDAWVDQEKCLTIPITAGKSRAEKRQVARRVFGLAASVVVAFSTSLFVPASVSADAQSNLDGKVALAATLTLDQDLITDIPSEFWSRAIAEVRLWKPAPSSDFAESPSII